MKKLFLLLLLSASLSCSKDDDNEMNNNNPPPGGSCGTFNGYPLYKDNGGCYYSDGYGGKTYVSADLCNC